MSLRSDYEARWRNPLTAAVVLTFDIVSEHGYPLTKASQSAAVVFGVDAATIRTVIKETMDDAMRRLRDEAA